MTPKHVVAVAIALGALVMIVGMQIESVVIRMIGATGHQLEWISDVIASVMVTTVTYLWLHLRITRAELLNAVRTRAIHDEQLVGQVHSIRR